VSRGCVLIVEDEPLVFSLAEGILGRAGYQIVPAHTLLQAVVIIKSRRTVDLVFTDIQLGDHADGGITVGELVNRERPGTPVLYTSGHATTCTPFLPKPYTDFALTKAVADLLPRSSASDRVTDFCCVA
jgi:two-component system cell cycle sensor histidine kinase/response regulator CckA